MVRNGPLGAFGDYGPSPTFRPHGPLGVSGAYAPFSISALAQELSSPYALYSDCNKMLLHATIEVTINEQNGYGCR